MNFPVFIDDTEITKSMEKSKRGIIVFAIALGLSQILLFDHQDLSWKNNMSNYFGLLCALWLIAAMGVSKDKISTD